MEPDFWNLQGKWKLVQKIGEFEKSMVKLSVRLMQGTDFWSELLGVSKQWGIEKSGLHCIELSGNLGTSKFSLVVKHRDEDRLQKANLKEGHFIF